MTYGILLILLLILLIISFFKFEKDILSPTFISCAVYSFSVLLAILGLGSWNYVEKLQIKVIFIIFLGIFAFFIGEILARKFFNKKEKLICTKNGKKNNSIKNKTLNPEIKVNKLIYLITIIFIFATGFLLISEIKKICNFYDFNSNSIPKMLAFYRTKIGLFSTDLIKDNIGINFIVKQMKKTCDVLCVIWMYIFFYNHINKVSLKKNFLNIFPILLCMLCTLLTSGRSLLMHMIVSAVMMFLILYFLEKKQINNYKILRNVVICAILSLGLFYIILPLTGRNTKANGFDYITFYLGTPIPSFNVSIDNKDAEQLIGEDTFNGIYYSLNKLGIIEYVKPSTHEWTKFEGFSSNVYTSIRSYYFDFGIIGVLLCQFVFGFFVSLLYLRIKNKKEPLLIIIYSYYGYVLIDQIRDEQFYNLLSTSTIAYLLIIIVLYFIYLKHQFIINYLKSKLLK